ncbi:TadE/TadG family type IV pilus assembly protein [Mesorhizobium sp. 10J20-29]
MTAIPSVFKAFAISRQGNFALITALLAPVLIGLVGGAIDLLLLQNHRSELQEVADSAVLAAASESTIKGWSSKAAKEATEAFVAVNLKNRFSDVTFSYKIDVVEKERMIKLSLSQDHYAYFVAGYFTGHPQIQVTAAARAVGQSTLCVVVLSPKKKEAFKVSGKSRVTASECSAYSNSVTRQGISVRDESRLTTELSCSAGGYNGGSWNYSPIPITDCPQIVDPLKARGQLIVETVPSSRCDFTDLEIKVANRVLRPGTYCGDLEITDAATVLLRPGIYVIKDGTLKVDKNAMLIGKNVGLVFVGSKAELELKNDSTLSLSAPETGLMAGILMYAPPVAGKEREFKIESRHAEELIGTVYMPADKLTVGGDKNGNGICDDLELPGPIGVGSGCITDVGTSSEWTAIVSNLLDITSGVNLVLNADYSGSSIPVPNGIGPNSVQITLTK